MVRIYAVANQKGGVGKTTTVINLGAYLASYGQRVLLIDMDPQSNATSSLGINKNAVKGGTYEILIGASSIPAQTLHNPHLKMFLLPSSPSLAGAEIELVDQPSRENCLKEALTPILDRYDYVLIDCPPSLGLLTLNGLMAAKDGIIIPVQCEYLALEGLGQLTQTLNRIRASMYPELKIRGVILTMYDGRTKLAKDVVLEVQKFFQDQMFHAIIPRSIYLAEAPSQGLPISEHAPSSHAAKAYAALAHEILEADGIHIPMTEE